MDISQTEECPGNASGSQRALLPVVVALLGVLLSMMVYLFNSHQEMQRYQQSLQHAAMTEAARMQSAVDRSLEVLVAFGGLFNAEPRVTRQTYQRFAGMVLAGRPEIRAMHWALRIDHAQRPQVEAELKRIQPNFIGIADVTPGADKRHPAGFRQEYFPILYTEPFAGNELALGLDPLARPYNTRTIRAAARHQVMDTTPAFPIVQDPTGPLAVAIYNPVYRAGQPMANEEQRWRALQGYIIMMLRPEVLSQRLWPEQHAADMSVTLLDRVDGALLQIFPRRLEGPGTAVSIEPGEFDIYVPLHVPGRDWVLLFRPSQKLLRAQSSALPMMLLIAMLVLTAMVYWLAGRTIRRMKDANGRLLERQRVLDELVHTDALTGLLNRSGFDKALSQYQKLATSGAVCVIDLDGFKPVNDRYGHAAGDEVLVNVAQRLRYVLGEHAVLARTGGDEFVAMLTEPSLLQQLNHQLETLVTQLAAPIDLVEGQQVNITASVGVALVNTTCEQLSQKIRLADDAMYCAKRQGKGRYCMAETAAAAREPFTCT